MGEWTVRAAYFFHAIADRGAAPSDAPAVPGPGGVFAMRSPQEGLVLCGIHTGRVLVRTRALTEPPSADPHGWDVVEEVSMRVDSGALVVTDWDGGGWERDPGLAARGPGWYRVRAHVRGRAPVSWDPDVAPAVPEAPEEHDFCAWPEPGPHPPRLLAGPDDRGAHWVAGGAF
jgi:hypothetical protein